MSNSSARPEDLRSIQMAFGAHLRDPENHAGPEGMEERRLGIYRQLFFNNINKFLSSNFPVLREIHDDDAWRRLVRAFCIEHRCHTPLFPEIPKEFLRYLQDGRKDEAGDPPWLLELAHYEWVELALELDETDPDDVKADPDGDLMGEVPLLSPLAWPLSYRWPVHRIGPAYQPDSPPEEVTHLLVYRRRDEKVRFMKLNAVSRLLLALMQEERNLTGRQLLQEVAERTAHPRPQIILEKGAQLLLDLREREVILGT